jgi:hypothetical protein
MALFDYEKPETLEQCESDLEVVVMMNATVFMMTALAASFVKGEKESPIAGSVHALIREFSAQHQEDL